jgi:hypothetical protein
MTRSIARTVTAGSAMLLSLTVVGTTAGSARPSAAGHPPFGTIATTNFADSSLLTFPPGSTGDVAPNTRISGAATGLDGPTGLAYDRRGNLYVANYNGNSITEYGPNANGNAVPIRTISGSNTTLNEPFGLAVAPSGDIWVGNFGDTDVLEFAANAGGNAAPTRTIAGSNTGLNGVDDVEVTTNGKRVLVACFGVSTSASIREFSTSANGNAAPLTTISGSHTQLEGTRGVAVTPTGAIGVSNTASGGDNVLRFAPNAQGDATPRKVISGSNTGLNNPYFIAFNPVGETWVANYNVSSLTRYPAGASGNTAPDHQLMGSTTTLSGPIGVAVYSQPPSAPRALKKHMHGKTLKLRWHRPASNGGGIEGYVVRHAKHKSGKFHTVKTTKKRHYTKHHAAHGYYDVLAFNQAGYSKHSKRVHVT